MIGLNNVKLSFFLFGSVFYFYYFLLKPVYIILGLGILLGYFVKKYFVNYSYIFSSMFFILYLMFVSVMGKTDIGMVLNAVISIFVFPIFYFFCRNLKSLKPFIYFLNISFVYYFAEMIYRISFPIYKFNPGGIDDEWFYPYKLNSFIFGDSNFVALHLFCLLFISIILRLKIHAILFFILIFLTFSRSAILGAILAFLYYLVNSSRYTVLIKPFFYLTTFLIFLYCILNISLITDGSFLSKLYILDSAIYYAENNFTLYQYLFGNGLSQTFDAIGIGAHNILVILLFETGIIGTIVYLTYIFTFFLFKVSNKSCKSNLFVFLGLFFLMGFSLGLYLFPIMVLTIAVILSNMEGKNDQ